MRGSQEKMWMSILWLMMEKAGRRFNIYYVNKIQINNLS
jgi:hypothetical protein